MKICLECAEGGHFNEMLCILQAFHDHNVFFITTRASTTIGINKKFTVYYVRDQYNLKNKWAVYLKEFLIICRLIPVVAYIIVKENPKAIVSTGGGSTIPLFYIGKILGKKTIFIESMARITSPSLTGRIVYPVTDLFLVQWEVMQKFYKKSKCWGTVI